MKLEHLTNETFKQKIFNYETNKEWKFEGNTPAIIDFYADWCVDCKKMDRYTFTEASVIEALDGMLLLKADVTAKTEAVVPETCIFASNTSTLPITGLAEASERSGKRDTPTMGGSFLVASLLVAVLLWSRLDNLHVVLAVLLTAALAVAGGWVLGQALAPAAPEAELLHASLLPPPETAFSLENGSHFALSPDGSHLVFVAADSVPTRNLWVRELSRPAAYMLTGTQDASYPFWSPDSKQIAFFADGKLKKLDLNGGAPMTVTNASDGRGGTWNSDGTILFAPNIRSAIHRVAFIGESWATSTQSGWMCPVIKSPPSQTSTRRMSAWFLSCSRHAKNRSSSSAMRCSQTSRL